MKTYQICVDVNSEGTPTRVSIPKEDVVTIAYYIQGIGDNMQHMDIIRNREYTYGWLIARRLVERYWKVKDYKRLYSMVTIELKERKYQMYIDVEVDSDGIPINVSIQKENAVAIAYYIFGIEDNMEHMSTRRNREHVYGWLIAKKFVDKCHRIKDYTKLHEMVILALEEQGVEMI